MYPRTRHSGWPYKPILTYLHHCWHIRKKKIDVQMSSFWLDSISNSDLLFDVVRLSIHPCIRSSVYHHFNICLDIQKTVGGIISKLSTHVHFDKTFHIRVCLDALDFPTLSNISFSGFLFAIHSNMVLCNIGKISTYKLCVTSFLSYLLITIIVCHVIWLLVNL